MFVVACNSGSATPAPSASVPAPAHAVADANPATLAAPQLFAMYCAQCHGTDAKGYKSDHAPSLVNPAFLASATAAYLTASIEQGRPGTAMAAYGKAVGGPLDPAAVEKIVVWLQHQGERGSELVNAPAGDAKRGQPLYVATCQKCHGDAATRGEYLLLANPVFLKLATDAFIYHAIVHGRPGTPMEAFETKLGMQQIADIVTYIRSLAHDQTITPLPAPTGKEPLFVNPTGKSPSWKSVKEGRFVSVDEVKHALDAKAKLVIIDARPESEWMTVHITGAISIPHYQLARLAELPKDATIIAYCACPHHLSGIVVDELVKRGYKHAYVLDEGILEWQRRNYPVVAAQGVTPPPKEPELPAGVIR
ncbi:hypothetical protein BH11MYX1_BH11MYX1_03180 [soil metagenome]